MPMLKHITRGNASPKRKAKLFFTCHPADFDRSFERLTEDILREQDCAIYYTADMAEPISAEERELRLRSVKLFVIPVSLKLLQEPNRAMDEDYPYAVRKQIPVLPVMLEPGLEAIYSRPDRFGDLPCLHLSEAADGSGLSCGEELGEFLNSILGDEERAEPLQGEKWEEQPAMPGSFRPDFIAPTGLPKIPLAEWEMFYDFLHKALGEEHPETLDTLGIMAGICREEGDKKRELELLEKLYTQRCKALGEEHPDTLTALNNLAVTCGEMGDKKRERELLEKLYAQRCKVLGEEHPDTLETLSSLAVTCSKQGDYDRARDLLEKLYELRCKAQGEEHPETLTALHALALTCGQTGDTKRRRELLEKLYSQRCKVLGEKHPRTLTALQSLALTCSKLGDHKRALELDEKLYAQRCKVLGE